MAESPQAANPAESLAFEDALARLDVIVHGLEEGQVPLAEALAQYEEGIKLLKHCYQALATAQRRIELLSGVDSEGRAQREPFDDSATSPAEKPVPRTRRGPRSPEPEPPSEQDEMDGPGRLF